MKYGGGSFFLVKGVGTFIDKFGLLVSRKVFGSKGVLLRSYKVVNCRLDIKISNNLPREFRWKIGLWSLGVVSSLPGFGIVTIFAFFDG